MNDLISLCTVRNNKELFVQYLEKAARKEVYLVIAEHDGQVVGFGVLKLTGHLVPKLSDLYVKEDSRRIGIGSDLIHYRESLAKELGYSEIYVSVDPVDNPKMITLITRLGYHPISEPYLKTATFYTEDGTAYEHTYTRIDLKKRLD